jgi:carboxypeptidase C (cathepsin A)
MKKFYINNHERVFKKGHHLTNTKIASIHLLFNQGEVASKIAEELIMNVQTVKKYENTFFVNRGGGVKQYNNEVVSFIKTLLKDNPTLFLSEIQKRLEENLNLQRKVSTILRWLKDLNYTRKKVKKIAFYRTLERVQNLKASFKFLI